MIRPAPPAPFKTAFIAFLVATIVALLVAQHASARDANWKISIRVDYTSTGKVTDDHCFPTAEQESPSPVTATTSRKLTWRTARATSLQMYEAPNGVPAIFVVGPPYKAQITETRTPGVSSDGRPVGCYEGSGARNDCGTKSVRSGAYFGPLGKIHHWRGFHFDPEQAPSFENCGVSPAEDFPEPLSLDLRSTAKALTGHAHQLVWRKSRSFHATKDSGSIHSEATAKWTYTVKLIHR